MRKYVSEAIHLILFDQNKSLIDFKRVFKRVNNSYYLFTVKNLTENSRLSLAAAFPRHIENFKNIHEIKNKIKNR